MPISGHVRRYRERTATLSTDERKRRARKDTRTSFSETVKLLKVSQMRRAIYDVIKPGARSVALGNRLYDAFIVTIAFVSLLPLMFRAETPVLVGLERVAVYFLFLDYLLRWITADLREGREGVAPFVRYPFRIIALCQLVGMLPTLGAFPEGWGFLRVLRIAIVFYYLDDFFYVGNIMRAEKRPLISVIGLVAGFILISATVLYACEPGTFGNYVDALYWSVTTFASVGYGDYYPHTYLGKVISMVSMFLAILVVAVPTGVITAGYMFEMRKMREQGTYYMRPRSIKDTVALFRENGGMRVYLAEHRALTRYVLLMLLCFGIDVCLILVTRTFRLPLWLDTIGTALASSMLESAAGLLVGFGSTVFLATWQAGPSQLLFYVVPAATAVAYGLAFQRGRSITGAKVVRVVVTVVAIATVWDLVLAYALYGGAPTGAGEFALYQLLLGAGIPDVASKVAAVFCVEVVDKVITALFVLLFYLIAPDSWREMSLPPKANRGPDIFREGWFTR